DRRLVGNREVAEGRQCSLQVCAFGQLEGIETAAGHIEELIALNLTDCAKLAGELEALAEHLRLAVAAAFRQSAEFDRHERDTQEIVLQRFDRIRRPEPYAEAPVPQPPLVALFLPARERQDQRASAPLRIFVRIPPLVGDDLTLLDELAHIHEP